MRKKISTKKKSGQIYKPGYFDKEFFEGKTGKKGGDRIRVTPTGLGVVRGVIDVLCAVFHGKSFIDVGCGVGWFVKFLKEKGENACGVELSQYAVDNAVTDDITQGDILDLHFIEEKYDVVLCWNVMAYLMEKDLKKAVESLKHVSKGHIVLGIVTTEVLERLPHGRPGRLTVKPWDWWIALFEKHGLTQDIKLATEINNLGGKDWTVFCLKSK